MGKKLYIKTYGCQMNVYDSVRMADVMAPMGYSLSDTPEGADLVILNTCHIREKAEEKVYSDLGRIREEKNRKKGMLIAVGGCVGQAEGDEIIRRAPYVDMVVGSQSYHQLPDMVARASREKGGVVELDFPQVQKFDFLPESTNPQGVSAFLAVQEGCDKFCTFCVVPYTRGAEYSRPLSAIVSEAKKMVDHGTIEITLLGQNVNAYHGAHNGGEASLAELIDVLAQIRGLERIRYTTSHPREMSEDLITIHGSEPKLMPSLHLPIQSGSDEILKKMNRKHDAAIYVDIIHRLRAARADLALSSDFIVGFPGETEAHFEETMRLVQAVGYASSFSFKYSARPGTPAATQDNQVDEQVKEDRLARLQDLLKGQQLQFNESCIGKTLPVLLHKRGRREGQLLGKSPWLQSVHVQASDSVMNTIVDVAITSASINSLGGTIVNESQLKGAA
ncbi:MAG: tRNA (N6-isopentenyl adenosine(37)-C2)-methylthiotransferase MiaB [Alphaproteobacteria bacterium]